MHGCFIMQSVKMKCILAAVVLVSLVAVIHCREIPTDAQLQCVNNNAMSRETEVIEACGDAAMDGSVRF